IESLASRTLVRYVAASRRSERHQALMFASNWRCVTSQDAKAASADGDCSGGIDWARRGSLAWREPVCAITRRTSKDSAGTDTHSRGAAQDSQHECYAVGRTRTEWHHDSANLVHWSEVFS